MLKLLILAILILFLVSRLLPRVGGSLGRYARKPFRQAQWMWSWVAGSEAEAIAAEYEYGKECAREFSAQFPRIRLNRLPHLLLPCWCNSKPKDTVIRYAIEKCCLHPQVP